jgi:hypothetical protein
MAIGLVQPTVNEYGVVQPCTIQSVAYLRFIVSTEHPDTAVSEGLFGVAYALRDAGFRDDASEHISRMHEMKRVWEATGHVVHIVQEERIGYVVYGDEVQVIAKPFADTRTSL